MNKYKLIFKKTDAQKLKVGDVIKEDNELYLLKQYWRNRTSDYGKCDYDHNLDYILAIEINEKLKKKENGKIKQFDIGEYSYNKYDKLFPNKIFYKLLIFFIKK